MDYIYREQSVFFRFEMFFLEVNILDIFRLVPLSEQSLQIPQL